MALIGRMPAKRGDTLGDRVRAGGELVGQDRARRDDVPHSHRGTKPVAPCRLRARIIEASRNHPWLGLGHTQHHVGFAKRIAGPELRCDIPERRAREPVDVLGKRVRVDFVPGLVRRQGFWDNRRRELTEALAHQGCHFMLPLLDEASGAV